MTESASDGLAKALIDRSPDLLAIVDRDGVITYVSAAAQRILGYEACDVVGRNAFDLVHPDDHLSVYEGFVSTSSSADSRATPLLLRLLRADEEWLDVEIVATNHLNDPAICGLLLTIRDVSASMRTENALRESEEQYRLIVELAQEGIWRVDSKGTILYANRALAEMLGTTVSDLLGRAIFEFLDGDALAGARRFGRRTDTVEGTHDLQLVTKDGRPLWTRISASPLLLPSGAYNGALALVTNITERRELERRLEHDARYDALTGVANRHTLFDVLDAALHSNDRCAVLFADVDHFKRVNDTWGHQAGDAILRTIAERLSSTVRATDTVARVGGDEFVVVGAPVQSESEARALGARIPDALAEPVRISSAVIPVNVSVGIAVVDRDDDVDSILARADHALYSAKRAGRGRIEVAASR